MNNHLERIQILELHGKKDVDVKIKDNTLILVGENEYGKTTHLRILFRFLSGHWLPLVQFKFDWIVATIDGSEYGVNRKDTIEQMIVAAVCYLRQLPSQVPLHEVEGKNH